MARIINDYIAEADRLAHSRREAPDEPARIELARKEFETLAKAAESERDLSKLLVLRLRMANLPGIDVPRRVAMMIRAGACAERCGDRDQALSLAQGALEIAVNHGDNHGHIDALNELGVQWRQRGDLKRSEALLRESKDLASEAGDKSRLACACMNLSNTLRRALKTDEAATEIHYAIRVYRDLGDLAGATQALLAVAHLESARGHVEEERAILEDAIKLAELADAPVSRARALGNLGLTLLELGDLNGALKRLNEATDLFNELGMSRDAIRASLSASSVLNQLGEFNRAFDFALQGEELARRKQHPVELAEALSYQASYYIALGRLEDAQARASDSASLLEGSIQLLTQYANAETLGRVAAARENFDDALACFEKCERLGESANDPTRQARALRLQAECFEAMRDHDNARELALRSIELLDSVDASVSIEYLQAVVTSARIERDSGNESEARFLAEDGQNLRKELNMDRPATQELQRAFELLDQLAPQD